MDACAHAYAGYVSSDIFNTRIIKPPTSVVVFPLKGEGQEVYGVVYCLSCVHSSFTDISPKLREICEVRVGVVCRQARRQAKSSERGGGVKAR